MIRGNRQALDTDGLQAERKTGKRRASVQDFHSFRGTWITLALPAGVPFELVQRVTGHRTAQAVMKHDFRPGREDFRAAIFKAMPKMLADGGPAVGEGPDSSCGAGWERPQFQTVLRTDH